MKKVLYDKNGIFISIHNGDYQLTELNDGDCLTHEDGTIIIYKESEGEPLFENMYFHAYYKNGSFHLPKNTSSFYDYVKCGYRFSTPEEKKFMNNVLSENKLYYDEKEKCLKMFHWRAVKGNSYYYINSDSMEVLAATEMDSEEDRMRYGNFNYFPTRQIAERKLFEIKSILND
jgi:hypothetical protein